MPSAVVGQAGAQGIQKTQSKATVETADTSNVPAAVKPVITSLTRVYKQSASAATSAVAKRKLEDVNKRIGGLFERLNQGGISGQACDKLLQLCAALDANDFNTAGELQVALTTHDWEENSTWIIAIKRLMDTAKASAPR